MTSHLEIQAPSSTTVCYVVRSSKRPSSKALTIAKHALRIIIAFHVLLFNIAKLNGPDVIDPTLQPLTGPLFRLTLLGGIIYTLAGSLEWWMVAAISAIVLFLCIRRDYTEESLLVLQGLGIQTSTISPYYFLSATTTFIPTTRIQDMVIHEAFKGLGVRFYLAIIVEGATEVVVVFPTLLPRLEILQEVWRGARKCLYSNNINTNPKPG